MVYIITFLALAAFPLALAGYGDHLAAKILKGKERTRALRIVWGLTILGLFSFGLQQYLTYRSDVEREKDRQKDRDHQGAQFQKIDAGIEELKRLTLSKPTDPPEKVLAAAAAKILELDAKTTQLEAGVKDITATRRLDYRQKNILQDMLRSENFERKIDFVWETDSDSLAYANDFFSVFEAAKSLGYRNEIGKQFKPRNIPKGLLVAVKDWRQPPKEAIALVDAFNKANIPYTAVSDNSVRNLILIVVGFRRQSSSLAISSTEQT
jgi:hypothetical protein